MKRHKRFDYILLFLLMALLFFGSWRLANYFYTQELISQQEETLGDNGRILRQQLNKKQLTATGNQKIINDFAKVTNERITLLDTEAKIIYDSYDKNLHGSRDNRPEIKTVLDNTIAASSVRYSKTLKTELLYTAQPILKNKQLVGIIRIAKPTSSFESKTRNFRRSIFIVLMLFYFVIYGVIYYLIYQRNRPIETVLPVLKRMVKEPEKSNYVMQNSPQWQELYLTINQLSERVNQTYAAYNSTEKQFTTLFHDLTIGVFIIDGEGKILMMNPSMEEILQVGGATQHYFWEIIKDPKLIQLVQQILVDKKQLHQEITLRVPIRLDLDVHLRYFENAATGDQIMGTVYDLTHVRHLEKIQKDFVGNVSHELKTPVTSLIGFTETLLDGAKDDPDLTTEFLEIMQKDALRLQRLIMDIIELSKDSNSITDDQWQVIDLEIFIQQQVQQYRHWLENKNISVSIEGEAKVLYQTHLTFFQPIIKNLLENAIQYSSEDSQITIAYTLAEKLVIQVKDTGIGISAADQTRIFERFYRIDKARSRHSGGTGLGLSIVKEYSEYLGGNVIVESHPQLGSTFIVTLPK